MIDWCYPLLVWALIFGAATRGVQVLLRGLGPRWLPLLACATAVVPVQGLPLGRWLHGYNANFSIPLVAVLLGVILKPWLKRPLFNEQADRTSCWFGCVAGLLLYPFALGLSSFDPYSLGWQWPGVACVAAVLAVFLIWRDNSFGLVLLAAGVAWQIGCLESDNAWDYLVDPLYVALSFIGLTLLLGQATLKRNPEAPSSSTKLPAAGSNGSDTPRGRD